MGWLQVNFLLVAIAVLIPAAAYAQPTPPPQQPFVETVHGVAREDSYRWMEAGGDEFVSWAREEATWAKEVLEAIRGRTALLAEIKQLDRPSPGISNLQARGGRWLFETLPAGAESRVSVLRNGEDGKEGPVELLSTLPKNAGPWSEVDHARVLSPDGRYLAFGTTQRGEDEPAIRVYDLDAKRLLPDVIVWPLWADSRGFRPRWLTDSSGFFYVRNPAATAKMDNRERARGGQVFLHRLGMPAADDRPIFGFGITNGIEAADTLYVEGEPNPRWLAVLNRKPSGREIWVVDLRSRGSDRATSWRAFKSDALVPGFGVHDNKLYTLDNMGAERYRLVSVDLTDPSSKPEEIISQQDGVLGHLQVSEDAVHIVETRLGESRLHIVNGKTRRLIKLPDGSVESVTAGPDGKGAWVEVTDWLRPRSGWLVRSGQATAIRLDRGSDLRPAFDLANITELHWAIARDGVRIPYTLVRRANARPDRSGYVMMSGYGCFGSTNSPFYWPALNAWLRRGGLFVHAGVRGGGELGSAWHSAGSDRNKPTSFEDGIDVVRHLIASGWSKPGKIGVTGGSCGGATMGMAALEAPHLIGAAALSGAALDMHRVAVTSTAGARSIREFGDPQTAEGMRRIDALSPYRQLLPGAPRPALLIISGATDYTIPLWMGGKFVAAARATNSTAPPVLWRIDWTAGHNVGRDYAAEDADLMSFLFQRLGHPDFQPHK